MAKIVFFSIPAKGHINPTLNVVRRLVSDGHQVWYYSYNSFKEEIESTGASFISCDSYDFEQKLTPSDGAKIAKNMAFAIRVLVNTTLALDEVITADMKTIQPDCIVADSMAFWGKAIALKLGIPYISSTTTFAFNRYSSEIMPKSLSSIIRLLIAAPKAGKEVKRLKDKGYPVNSFLDIIQNDNNTDTIVYTSPEFQPASETFSDKYAFVGLSVRCAKSEFTKTSNKLIYISMGSVNNNMPKLYKKFIKAFSDTDYQVVISVGDQISTEIFTDVPENIWLYNKVDQLAVLEKADLFITHCGMNSVSESLYCEVPLIMYPQTDEQMCVATRVAQLGAGKELKRADIKTIKITAEAVLKEKSYRENAKRISGSFKACQGADGAAEKILSVIKA